MGLYSHSYPYYTYANVWLDANGYVNAAQYAGSNVLITGSTALDDGNPHMLALTWSGALLTLWVDGVSIGTAAIASLTGNGAVWPVVAYGFAPEAQTFGQGGYQSFVVWDSDVSTNMAALWIAFEGITVPSAPVLSGVAGTLQNALTWTTPANGGAAITDYSLLRGLASSGESATPIEIALVNAYTDNGLTGGTLYYYEVYATNSAGHSAVSNEVELTPLAALSGLPNAPPPSTHPTQALVKQYIQTGPPIGWGPSAAGRGRAN
jgi:hypothetical protein